MLFGSNYPRVEIKNMARAVRGLGLSDECLDLVFRNNAEKLLGGEAMIIKLERIEVQSRKDMEMIDITAEVERVVAESGARNGMVLAMTTHTSSGLLVTEGIECLERDVLAHLERLAPKEPPEGSATATGTTAISISTAASASTPATT